ncbi:Peptidase S46 [compost metagenome]
MFLLLSFLSFIGMNSHADEGLYKPTKNILNSALEQAAYSVVAFDAGSAVVIDGKRILTAYHVIANCGCPQAGVPKKCVRSIRAPKEIDQNGNVISWLNGTTTSVLACGKNADRTKSDLYEMTLKELGFSNSISSYDDGPFWPRQDLAVLQVEFLEGYPPSIPLRKVEVRDSENLYVMGYPGKTIRDSSQKSLRSETVSAAIADLKMGQRQFARGLSFDNGLTKLRTMHDSQFKKWSDKLESFPNGSPERSAIALGYFDILSSVNIFLSIFESGGIKRTCEHWKVPMDRCQSDLMSRLLKKSTENATELLQSIISTNGNINYPEADKTLRVSFGKFKYYQDNPTPNFKGALWTDIDGASGNSGGPVFDRDGYLVGIVVLGPDGISLGYVERKGIGAISHWGIESLLKNVPYGF